MFMILQTLITVNYLRGHLCAPLSLLSPTRKASLKREMLLLYRNKDYSNKAI